MIEAGAFGKIIEVNDVPDEQQGMIDRNSYNKDNTTNYINYDIAEQNRELIDFYSSVLRLRQIYPQLRKAPRESLEAFYADSEFGIGYHIPSNGNYEEELLVLVNGSPDKPALYNLPGGMWTRLLSTDPDVQDRLLHYITLPPSSGVILKK